MAILLCLLCGPSKGVQSGAHLYMLSATYALLLHMFRGPLSCAYCLRALFSRASENHGVSFPIVCLGSFLRGAEKHAECGSPDNWPDPLQIHDLISSLLGN